MTKTVPKTLPGGAGGHGVGEYRVTGVVGVHGWGGGVSVGGGLISELK